MASAYCFSFSLYITASLDMFLDVNPNDYSDYNFELDNHGACSLVPGFQPISKEDYCKKNPDAVEFYESSGYRRIPLTTCEGGLEMDKQSVPVSCPGREDDFEKIHKISGWSIFFAVVIPIGLAMGAGYWVWTRWDGKFGQIRLGDHGHSEFLDADNPWIKYPVMVTAGLVAVVVAIPSVMTALWRSSRSALDQWGVLDRFGTGNYTWLPGSNGRATRRFTTRDSFARSRDAYAIVDEDEGELLGEESDEEV